MDAEFMKWLNEEAQKAGSIRKFAARVGVSHTTVTDVINGTRAPTFEFVHDVARAVGIPPEQAFRMAGLLPRQTDADDEMIERFLDYWANLPLDQRKNVLRVTWAFYLESQGVEISLDTIRGPDSENENDSTLSVAPDPVDS